MPYDKPNLTDQERVHLYQEEEWSIQEIAQVDDMSPSYVRRRLLECGVEIKRRPSRKGKEDAA